MVKNLPEAKYTKFGEKIRHVIPGPVQCSVACGGRNCKWENPSRWTDEDQAIKGVFSSWVLEDVVAMSRPSTDVIKKYNLLQQFKDNNICSIINLQRPGEHASCGPPLHKESQFTYDPQVFMDNDVFFYNFGWKDYGVASLETILDMVKVMAFAISEGKVAVHCHAGLGRTGVLIACYLVFAHRKDASEAINTVRKQRPNSIQTRGQIACIQEFAQFLKPLRIVFPQVVPHAERLTLVEFLHRQRHLLHGFESRELRHLPKIISLVCQRLIDIANSSQDFPWHEVKPSSASKSKNLKKKRGTLRRSNTVETLKEAIPGAFVNEQMDIEDETFVDNQKIDAILSPRLTMRKDSAKSRSSSEAKSFSRPESPISDDLKREIEALTEESTQLTQQVRKTTKSPILVSSAPTQMVPMENADEKDGDVENTPGKPKVVLVKQGSRPALLPSPMDVPQTFVNAEANLNNNNQFSPRNETEQVLSSVTIVDDSDSKIKQDSVVIQNQNLKSSHPQTADEEIPPNEPIVPSLNKLSKCKNLGESETWSIASDKNVGASTKRENGNSNYPTPTISVHEPQISPRFASSKVDTSNPSGAKIHRYTKSEGRIVPTGLPPPLPLKGISLSLLAGDTNISAADDIHLDLNNKMLEPQRVNDDTDETSGVSSNDGDEVPAMDPAGEEDPDHEFEEILEIKDDQKSILSEYENENDAAVRLGSAKSKISWPDPKNEGNVNIENETSNEAKHEDKKTSLMYRAEKTHELIENEDQASESSIEETDEIEKLDIQCKMSNLALLKPSLHEKRPKSASFLRRLVEKSTAEQRIPLKPSNSTQSLCDLRCHEGLTRDDLYLMKSQMTSDLFSPLTPTSKSSSSDDLRTPTGSASKKRIKDPITVAMALAYKLTDNEWLWEKVYSKQVELNTREGAWSSIEEESDAHLLSCLMWSWIEHLSKPILSFENVKFLVKESKPIQEISNHATECPDPTLFEKALSNLEKPVSSSLQCILKCLLSLPQLSFDMELSVIMRVTAALTQSNMENGSISTENQEFQKSYEQLVCLIQNYLVKTRARNTKKQSVSEINDKKDVLPKRASEPTINTADNQTPIKTEFSRGEGDTVGTSAKVPELPLGIAVS